MNKPSPIPVVADKLYITHNDSVQPNILLRTPLFSPVRKREMQITQYDVTDSLRNIELVKVEGYESVSIIGQRLDVETDFKVWCGIVFALSTYGYSSDTITFKFSEFIKFCGFKPKKSDKALRQRIEASLIRIKSQSVNFRVADAKKMLATSLVLRASYDADEDVVVLQGDPDLWEVYRVDHQILVSMKTLSKMPRAEVAQCLYLFIASLPKNPIPITLTRFRDRLQSNLSLKEANRSIKVAIGKLESIGYLKGQWVTFNGEAAYQVQTRSRELADLS